jgi:hypothetical protein
MSRVDSYASHPARTSANSPDSDTGADGNDSTTVGDGEGLRLGLGDGVGLTALEGGGADGPGTDGVHPTNSTKHTSR